ncbi:hypothetical protein, partial [Escherichia coli]|uniref:hypothetical protein n=1 Tax=Escherichia coli TaxID=562 RepID=UPI001BD13713
KWSHFLPESITDLPLVARHTSPSEIIILYYLTIPFGIGSYSLLIVSAPKKPKKKSEHGWI